MLLDFLTHLHRGGSFAYYHVLPQRRSVWYEVGEDAGIEPGRAKTNLYFSVHPSKLIPPCNAHGEVRPPEWVRSQLRTIAAINCLFAEYDTKDHGDEKAIEQHLDSLCVPAPSVTVHSGAGLHVYWLLNEPYVLDTESRLEAAKHMQASWVKVVGGDPGAHDLARILRVPGSRNFKYSPPPPVRWGKTELGRTYPLVALTAHLPVVSVPSVERIQYSFGGSISDFNEAQDIGQVLERHGYQWAGSRKMLSPWSSTGQPGVTIDSNTNRAYIHHGSDPLHDGYWKRPFDVVKILDYDGDFKRALAALRDGSL